MTEKIYIQSYVHISNKAVSLNGNILPIESSEKFSDFAKNIYNYLQLSYPKFYKMDNLSKFGMLAAEFVLINQSKNENTSLIFGNLSSSLDTDIIFHNSIKSNNDFLPSPSVFVYTLPNIVIGEICIKHKFMGENLFFILDDFDANTYIESLNAQVLLKKSNTFIISWVEVLNDTLNIFSCYLSPKVEKNNLILNRENLNTIYKNPTNGRNS